MTVEQDPVFGVPAHGLGEGSALDIRPHRRERLGGMGVVDSLDVLFDDRSLVEVRRHVVCGRAPENTGGRP